tara:strand:- start:5269 stop:5565 length:297 start_codon:yes stop_codon:yes gene_type:complete
VATDADVPGIFIKIAGIAHPKPPPVKIAVRNKIAGTKSIYRVIGRKIAMPIDIESPGTAPNTRPRRRPGTITNQTVISAESREIAPINGLRSGINFFL